jgi:pyridoxine 5'-phosphate synthase PdxJ
MRCFGPFLWDCLQQQQQQQQQQHEAAAALSKAVSAGVDNIEGNGLRYARRDLAAAGMQVQQAAVGSSLHSTADMQPTNGAVTAILAPVTTCCTVR